MPGAASLEQQQAASGPSRARVRTASLPPPPGAPSSSLLAALHSFDELSCASSLCLADLASPPPPAPSRLPQLRACPRRGTPGQRAMPGGPTDEEMRAASREAKAARERTRVRHQQQRQRADVAPPKTAWRAMESWTTGESSAASRSASEQAAPAPHVQACESAVLVRPASAPPPVVLAESPGLPTESLLPAARLAAQQALQAERDREEAAQADDEAALASLEREEQREMDAPAPASDIAAEAPPAADPSPGPSQRQVEADAAVNSGAMAKQSAAAATSTAAIAEPSNAAAASSVAIAEAPAAAPPTRAGTTSSDAPTSGLSHRAQVLLGNKRGARLGVGRPAAPPVVPVPAAPVTSSPVPDPRAHLEPIPFDDDEDPFTSSVSSSDHAQPGSDPALPMAADPPSEVDEPPLYFHGSRRPDATFYTTQAASAPTRAPTRAEKLAAAQEARQQRKIRLAAEIKDAKAGQKQGTWHWTTTQDIQGDVTDPSLDMSTSRASGSRSRPDERIQARPGWKSRMLLPPSMLGEPMRRAQRQTASSPGAPTQAESETESEGDDVPAPQPSCSLPPPAAADDSVTESEDDGPLLQPGVQPRRSPEKSKARLSPEESRARVSTGQSNSRRRVLMREPDEAPASKRQKSTRRPAERTASAPNLLAPTASGSRPRRRNKNVVPGAPIFADCVMLVVGYEPCARRVRDLILKHGGTLASDFSVQSRITLTHIVGAPTAGERGNERDVADWAAELFPREPRAQLSVTALRAREEVPRQTFVHAAWIYDCVQHCVRSEDRHATTRYRALYPSV